MADDGNAAVLKIRLSPRASRDAVLGRHGDRVKISITSPPVDGQANEHLVKFVAKKLGVAKSRVEITAGHTSKDKTLRITGVDQSEAVAKLLS
ncbi:MAG: YggU family protein [Deltaproteobacteria bacterium]|nr:YggU family protein [bacterium]MCB9477691.1 YggU family protein [Deltaproteobacteria bacterium]MCB9488385.1 YggU family protein [Deltaproteobacteria bacterium]